MKQGLRKIAMALAVAAAAGGLGLAGGPAHADTTDTGTSLGTVQTAPTTADGAGSTTIQPRPVSRMSTAGFHDTGWGF